MWIFFGDWKYKFVQCFILYPLTLYLPLSSPGTSVAVLHSIQIVEDLYVPQVKRSFACNCRMNDATAYFWKLCKAKNVAVQMSCDLTFLSEMAISVFLQLWPNFKNVDLLPMYEKCFVFPGFSFLFSFFLSFFLYLFLSSDSCIVFFIFVLLLHNV